MTPEQALAWADGKPPCDSVFHSQCDIQALHVLAAEVRRRHWIPVGERLPDAAPFIVRWDDAVEDNDCIRYEVCHELPVYFDWPRVTHWIPLPEPPTNER